MKLQSKLSKTYAAAALAGLGLAIVAWSPTLPDKVVKIGAGGSTSNFQGFVAGDNNTVNTASTSGYACVIGNGHNGSALASIVAGGVQSCDTAGSLVTGYNNTVGGIPTGIRQPLF